MKNYKKVILSIFVCFCAAVSFAAEKKSQEIQPRFALVIGNQNYEQSKLDNPIKDAKLIQKVLEDSCFDVSFYVDLDRDGVEQAIEDYANKVNAAGPDVVSFFYYSGHGVQIDGENYLVPVNDKEIDSEIKAKTKCFAVNNLFSFVKAKTQIFVLDACRNNPFTTKKQNFSKGLSPIQAPKGINFLYLFSTQAGETAEDGGENGNSLFTSILAKEMKELNVPINTVFSNVSLKVADASGNRQKPLYTGTSVDFMFMNEAVASWKLAQLKQKAESLKASSKTADEETKKTYTTETNLINKQIEILEERKKQSKKDAEEKERLAKEQEERAKELQKETEKARKEAEKHKKLAQASRAKDRSSSDFISEIESNKSRLQKIRKDAFDEIVIANDIIDEDAQNLIEVVKEEDHSPVDYDANGKLTKAAQKEQNARIQKILDDAAVKKHRNFENYKEPIQEEEEDLLEQISKDYKTLKNAHYTASSFINELSYEVLNRYDGEKKLWTIKVSSQLFNNNGLINEKIDIPYSGLQTKPNEPNEIYSENVQIYDALLRNLEESAFEVRVEYTLKPLESMDSAYLFTATEVSVFYHGDDDDKYPNGKKLSSKKVNVIREVSWPDKTHIETVEDMVAAYNRSKNWEAKKTAIKNTSEKTKASIGKVVDNANTGLSQLEEWGGEQIPVEGLVFGLGGGNGVFAVQAGWAFPIGNNFFAGPAFIFGGGKRDFPGISTGMAGLAGFVGFDFTYNFDVNAIRPYVYLSPRFDSISRFGFSTCFGCEYVFTDLMSVGANFGFDISAENKFGVLFNVETTIPLDTIKRLF